MLDVLKNYKRHNYYYRIVLLVIFFNKSILIMKMNIFIFFLYIH